MSSHLWFSYAHAVWSQHPSPAQSYLQDIFHSHGAGGAHHWQPCGCTAPQPTIHMGFAFHHVQHACIKHEYSEATDIACNEVPLKTLSLLWWLQDPGRYFRCRCVATPPCVCSRLSQCLPQFHTLPRDLLSPTVPWGTDHLAGRDCVSAPPMKWGPWWKITADDLYRVSSFLYHHCVNPVASNQSLSALSGWEGLVVVVSITKVSLFKISSCSVFSSNLAVVSVLLQSVGLMDSHLFQGWHVLS